ncbi:ornithine carbamoyltransferase [Rhizobium leguminosarum]|uniref:ornithine carbamoyltransferase n=1 Tax=Rhizobium leguminosarum TaxID=384 RepID=UPI003ECF190B
MLPQPRQKIRHFIDISDLSRDSARWIIEAGKAYRSDFIKKRQEKFLEGRTIALLLEKPATRTRMHFELVGRDLGAEVLIFPMQDMMTSRGETIADTARVLSRHIDFLMYRAETHEKLLDLARNSTVPVINGMSNKSHPFRTMTEVMTFEQVQGSIQGRKVVLFGDCSQNTLNSWIHAAAIFDCRVVACGPESLEYRPDAGFLAWAKEHAADVSYDSDPKRAIKGADLVVTDTWAPVAKAGLEERLSDLAPYQVNEDLLAEASDEVLFVHPLPAHRGREVTAGVIDGSRSITWAGGIENKRFILPAILKWADMAI